MRGPRHKWVNPIRRTWRCPACGYERHVSGVETTVRCRCAEGPFMKLVAEPRFRRPPPKPLNLYFEAEELLGRSDGEAGPPAAAAHAAAEEFGAGTSAGLAGPGTPEPAPPTQLREDPVEESRTAAPLVETLAAPGLRTADSRGPQRGEAARPDAPSDGPGRSTAGAGRRPRDQRRRGGRPRGPQAPRE